MILKQTTFRFNQEAAAGSLDRLDRLIAQSTAGAKNTKEYAEEEIARVKLEYAEAHEELQEAAQKKLPPKVDQIPRELVERLCQLYIELKETRDQAKEQEVSLTEIPKGTKKSPPLKRKYWNIVSNIMGLRKKDSTFQKIPAGESIFKERYLNHERFPPSKFAPIYDAYDAWLKSGNEPIQGIDTEKLKSAFDS